MARKQNTAPKIRSTFFTSTFVISWVLFFLAIFAFAAIYSNVLVKMAQEEFSVMITLPDHAGSEKRAEFQEYLEEQPYTQSVSFISKDSAAAMFQESLGEDFLGIMDGMNPLPPSFNVYLNTAYIQTDSFNKINAELINPDNPHASLVQSIEYPIEDIEQMRANYNRFVQIATIIGLLVALIAFFIINSTIRLSIYGRRLMLRSMQLIGATNRFIRAPFVRLGMMQGFLGGVFANVFLILLILALQQFDVLTVKPQSDVPIWGTISGYGPELLYLLGGILIFGALIGWTSSIWAVNRFLNRSLDQII